MKDFQRAPDGCAAEFPLIDVDVQHIIRAGSARIGTAAFLFHMGRLFLFLSHRSRKHELHLTDPDYTTTSYNGWPGEKA